MIQLLGASAGTGSYTESHKSFHIIDLNCNGNEDTIFNCSYNNVQHRNCYYYEDAYVQCPGILNNNLIIAKIMTHSIHTAPNTTDNCINGKIRLANGGSRFEGRVELCYGSVWGSVCSNLWDSDEAKVVCRQLGYITIGQQDM